MPTYAPVPNPNAADGRPVTTPTDTALHVSFTSMAATDWSTAPADVGTALDQLAARVKTLENPG